MMLLALALNPASLGTKEATSEHRGAGSSPPDTDCRPAKSLISKSVPGLLMPVAYQHYDHAGMRTAPRGSRWRSGWRTSNRNVYLPDFRGGQPSRGQSLPRLAKTSRLSGGALLIRRKNSFMSMKPNPLSATDCSRALSEVRTAAKP